jgi:hypothetical protein
MPSQTPKPFLPLKLGLAASAAFFVGYIAVGLQGWGPAAAKESAVGEVSRWCERVQPGLFHEPVNALSNIGFMVAGLWMLWVLGRDVQAGRTGNMFGHNPIALLYAGAAIWLGPGSLLMHGTHTEWGGWADNLSMVMYILIPWLINVATMGRWPPMRMLGIYAALVVIYAVGRGLFGSGMGINLDFFGLSIAFWIISEVLYRFWSQWLRIASGFVGFAVAGVFGITPMDMLAAPEKFWWITLFWVPGLLATGPAGARRTYLPWFALGVVSYMSAFAIWQTGKVGHPMCDPDSLIQAHGIWHLLSAVATACFFMFLRTEHLRTVHLRTEPSQLKPKKNS